MDEWSIVVPDANNPHRHWRPTGTYAPSPEWLRQPTPWPTPPVPRTLPVPSDDIGRAQSSQIHNVLPRYAYSHARLRNAQFVNLDASAKIAVMARLHVTCPGPGNTSFIYSRLATSLRSLAIILLNYLILLYTTDIHVCNRIYWYTFIRGHTRAYAFTIASKMRIYSRFADWWRKIYWLLHSLQCGNAVNIDFVDECRLLSKHARDNKHWARGIQFWVYYDPQLVDTLQYILKDIFICITKEQCRNQEESTWRL